MTLPMICTGVEARCGAAKHHAGLLLLAAGCVRSEFLESFVLAGTFGERETCCQAISWAPWKYLEALVSMLNDY